VSGGRRALVLAIETATSAGSVALVSNERTIAGRYFDTGRYHSQRLFTEVEAMFEGVDERIEDVDGVAVSVGPGSFTGLRIGLSAAKGFCLAAGAALLTVPTLAGMAARVPYARAPVCPMLDARRGQVYTALYATDQGQPQPLSDVRIVDAHQVIEERGGETTVYLGDVGALMANDEIETEALVAPLHCLRPDAGAVGWLGVGKYFAGDEADLASAEPEYIRPPYVDEATAGAKG
jgi:tRNA threonylcarbamoyladenosine biosynthesis protein TsaB